MVLKRPINREDEHKVVLFVLELGTDNAFNVKWLFKNHGIRSGTHEAIPCPKCGEIMQMKQVNNKILEVCGCGFKSYLVDISYGPDKPLKTLAKVFDREYFEEGTISGYDPHRDVEGYRDEALYIKKAYPEAQKALDVGCAYGFTLKHLERMGVECVGVDISRYASRKRVISNYIMASVTHLPFKDKCFDLVYSRELLEHLPTKCIPPAVNEMDRIGKRNDHVIGMKDDDFQWSSDITHVNLHPKKWWKKRLPNKWKFTGGVSKMSSKEMDQITSSTFSRS